MQAYTLHRNPIFFAVQPTKHAEDEQTEGVHGGGVEKLPMAPLAAVFGVASGDRGSLVPAELIKNNHSVGGLYPPSSTARCELFKPSLKKVLGWISSGDQS